MNYQKIYDDFIKDRKSKEALGYYETHHIIPKSSGGLDEESNLIKLSARDHFFAHLLLSRFAGHKMKIALQYMLYGKNGIQSQNRYKPSSRRIGIIIEEANISRSHILKNRSFSEKHKENLSNAMRGRKAHNKGKGCSPQQREKLSNAMKGKIPWNSGMHGKEHLSKYKNKPKPPSMLGMKWINDGVNQKKIKSTDALPEGWSFGRIDMSGNNNPTRKKNDI